MSHYFADLKAAIKDIIKTQSTHAKNAAIYDYEETQPAGYPAITITTVEGQGEFLDTMRNRRDSTFKVLCMQERVEVGASESERILTQLVDELLLIFESSPNYNLENTDVFTLPPRVKWGYMTVPDAEVRSCELTITAVTAQ